MKQFHDPVGDYDIWRAKYTAARDAFRARQFPMTETVYRATLHGLGFLPREIDAEVNLALEST